MKSYKKIIMTLALGLTVSLGFSTISKAEVSDNATSLASVWEALESLSGSVTDTINNVLGGTGNNLTTTNKQVVPAINELDSEIGNLNGLTTTEKDTVVGAVNELDSEMGNLSSLQTTDKDSLVAAINSLKAFADSNNDDLSDKIGDLNTLTTTNKNTVVAAINEVDGDIGNLSSLQTTGKNNIVTAVNEVDSHADTANKNAGTWLNGQTIASGTTTKTITVSGMKGNDSIVEVYYSNASVDLLKQKHIDIKYTQSGESLTITFSKALPSAVTIDKINLINP